jgi:hypothetical protein
MSVFSTQTCFVLLQTACHAELILTTKEERSGEAEHFAFEILHDTRGFDALPNSISECLRFLPVSDDDTFERFQSSLRIQKYEHNVTSVANKAISRAWLLQNLAKVAHDLGSSEPCTIVTSSDAICRTWNQAGNTNGRFSKFSNHRMQSTRDVLWTLGRN